MRVPAVVMAGGRLSDEDARRLGAVNRALVEVGGRTLLSRVIESLRAAPSVGEIVVVGPVPPGDGYRVVDECDGFVANLFAGVDAIGEAEWVLVATSDMPFVSSEALDDVVVRGAATGADFIYPITDVHLCLQAYPGMKRTSVRTFDGRFTGGNAILARPGFLRTRRDHIAAVYEMRKEPVRLAGLMGWSVALRIALGKLLKRPFMGVADLERAMSRAVGGAARALISPHPSLATDADTAEELEALRSAG